MSSSDSRFRYVQITDTHIMEGARYAPGPDTPGASFELDTAAGLERVVAAISALEEQPAFVVVTGDLVSPDLIDRERVLDALDYAPSYQRLRSLLAGLPCPVHLLLGNHDHRAAFHEAFATGLAADARYCYSFDHGDHHFIALDSHVPGMHGGRLGADQLEWLDADLRAHASRLTTVFVHHHPWPIGHRVMDGIGLDDGDALMELLAAHPQTGWLLCGHVHLDHHVQRGRLSMLTSPATCFQLSRTSQTLHALPGPPAFRVNDIHRDSLSTRVVHCTGGEGGTA